ncbi:MAG: trypsin-like serine protease [Deltaproteobacteria bacterium]|nr:trypsin-like serine protease [Deltaproteobacteria bacterium]
MQRFAGWCVVVGAGLLACRPLFVDPGSPVGESGSSSSGGGASSSSGGSSSSSTSGGNADAGLPAECSGPNKHAPPGPRPVYYGTRAPSYLPLDAAQQRAVIGLAQDAPYNSSCSGTLIAARQVLTAKHCTEGVAGNSLYVLFGVDDTNPEHAVQVSAKHEHPDLDLTVLDLAEDPAATVAVTPIPIALEDLSAADVGMRVEQAGYGVTQTGRSDGRYFVAELFDGFEDTYLVVNGEGQHGVCYGDSGGPSMRIAPAGDVRVLGALGWGDPSCTGRDRYTRVELDRPWIEQWTGPTPGASARPCGSETAQGHCNAVGTVATWCESGALQQRACSSTEVCGWVAAASSWRCIPVAEDTCGGATAYGSCDGQVLHWCVQGTPLTRNCGNCQERCKLVDDTRGYACVASDCGTLDFLGVCNGAVAEWCNDQAQKETEDCAAQGESCGYMGPSTGWYCIPTACGNIDYLGTCQGNVVKWCEGRRLRQRDCAADGQVCRYQDATVGNVCTAP